MDTNFSDFQTYATYRSLSSSSGNKKSRNRQSISSSQRKKNSYSTNRKSKSPKGGSSQMIKRPLEFQDDADDDESNVPMLFRSYITPLSECNIRIVDDDEEDSVPRILNPSGRLPEKSTTSTAKATTSKSSSKSSSKSTRIESKSSRAESKTKRRKLTLSLSPVARSAPRVTFDLDNDDDKDESRTALEELAIIQPSTPEFIPESELDVVVEVVPESPKPSTSHHHEPPRSILKEVAATTTSPDCRILPQTTTQSNYRIDTSEDEEYSVDDADDDRRRRDYRDVDYANSPNAGYYVRKLLCVEESSDSGLDAVDRVDPFPMRRQQPVKKVKKKRNQNRRERNNNQRPQPQPPPPQPTPSKPSGSRDSVVPEPEHSDHDSDHYVVDDQYTQLQNQQQNPPPPPCPLSKSVINRRQVDRILTKLSRYAQLFGPRGSDNEEDDPTPEAIRVTLHLVEHMKKMNILFLNKDCQWLRDTSTGMLFERYLRLQVDARFVDLNSKTKLQLVCTVLPGSNYGPNGPFEFDGPLVQNRVKKSPESCVHPSCPYRNTKLSKSPLKSSTSEPTESVPDEAPDDDVSYAKKNDILPVGYSVLLMYNKGFSIPKESFIGGSTKVRIFPDWKLQHLRKGVRLCCQKYYYVMLNACNLLIE